MTVTPAAYHPRGPMQNMIFQVEPGGILRLVAVVPSNGESLGTTLQNHVAGWICEQHQHAVSRLLTGQRTAEFVAVSGVHARVSITVDGREPEPGTKAP